MNKLQQKLRKARQHAQLRILPARIKAWEVEIKAKLLKKKLPPLPPELQREIKRHAIDKSLCRLAARAFWPKSVMENYFQKEILPLIGTDESLKRYMVVRGLSALPKVARNGYAAHDFYAGLLDTAQKGSFQLKCNFVVAGVDALPLLMKADSALTEKLVKGLIQVAGDNVDLRRRVYGAVIDLLPTAVKYDFRLKPVTPALIAILRTAAGDDLKQPVVYKEIAVSPANPVSGHTSTVISMGDSSWKESYVSAGCFTGLAHEFKQAVDKKYPDMKSPGRVHYDAVVDFVRNAFEIMSVKPSLREAIKAKIEGAAPVAGAAWPVKKPENIWYRNP
jgi:hypothetical protein